MKIDTDGLRDRIINLPVSAGFYSDLGTADSGEVFYIIRPAIPSESSKLHKYNLKDRKDEEGAITLYKETIKAAQAEGDTTTAFLFMDILKDEEEHHDLFTTLLEGVM